MSKPPDISIRGIRQTIPAGYLMGRLEGGAGPAQLIRIADLAVALVRTGQISGGTTTVGITSLTAGPGIVLTPVDPITNTGTISAASVTAGLVSSDGTIFESTMLGTGLNWVAGALGITLEAGGGISITGTNTITNTGILSLVAGTNVSITGGNTISAGASTGFVSPSSIYLGGAAGRLSYGFYAGAGGNASAHDEGIQTVASLGTNSIAELRFPMPALIPSGTLKLHCRALANATTGAIKIDISDAAVAAGASPSAASLTAETQQTITWAAGDNDKYKEFKLALTPTPAADQMLVMAVQFTASGTTLAQIGTFMFNVIWE